MGFEHLEEVEDVEDWQEGEEREDADPEEIASEEWGNWWYILIDIPPLDTPSIRSGPHNR